MRLRVLLHHYIKVNHEITFCGNTAEPSIVNVDLMLGLRLTRRWPNIKSGDRLRSNTSRVWTSYTNITMTICPRLRHYQSFLNCIFIHNFIGLDRVYVFFMHYNIYVKMQGVF